MLFNKPLATLGAAARQTSCVSGSHARESGSTSPKKRNSREERLCRMKNAVDWYGVHGGVAVRPWLSGIARTERAGVTLWYVSSNAILMTIEKKNEWGKTITHGGFGGKQMA
jgi:hypothetical protein